MAVTTVPEAKAGNEDDVRGWLYSGEVFHRRRRPREHTLRYRVFSMLLDLDQIDELDSDIRWFSRNRLNLVSFHDRDFGTDHDATSRQATVDLRSWVSRLLSEAGVDANPSRILLSCYPRVLGYAFNPLSLYYCRDVSGHTYAVVHEVHNTFGERHAYVLPADQCERSQSFDGKTWIQQDASKELFVSPFADMNLHYRFRLNEPDERQIVVIHAEDSEGVLITASYAASRAELTTSALLMCVARMPLMTWKVMAGIHYEALKLWIKRVPLFSHIPKSRLSDENNHDREPTRPT